MPSPIRVGIIGAGSIGCYVGGRLLAASAAEVVLVGRARQKDELAAHGLTIRDFGSGGVKVPAARVSIQQDVASLANCDAVLVCVKSAQTADAARSMVKALAPGAVVVSLQNGVRNPEVLRAELPGRTVLAGIVSFNVVSRGDGLFHRTTSGPLMLQASDDLRAQELYRALRASGLEVQTRADLSPDQWTKLLVNLNNSVVALSGAPIREILLSSRYRHVVAALVEEAISALQRAGIRPARFRGVPVGLMPGILRLPTPLTRLLMRAQVRVDPQARSSMWEDLARRRPTEVDFLNGEVVRVAEAHGGTAPRNRRIVELVHRAEQSAAGSPGLSAEALWSEIAAVREP